MRRQSDCKAGLGSITNGSAKVENVCEYTYSKLSPSNKVHQNDDLKPIIRKFDNLPGGQFKNSFSKFNQDPKEVQSSFGVHRDKNGNGCYTKISADFLKILEDHNKKVVKIQKEAYPPKKPTGISNCHKKQKKDEATPQPRSCTIGDEEEWDHTKNLIHRVLRYRFSNAQSLTPTEKDERKEDQYNALKKRVKLGGMEYRGINASVRNAENMIREKPKKTVFKITNPYWPIEEDDLSTPRGVFTSMRMRSFFNEKTPRRTNSEQLKPVKKSGARPSLTSVKISNEKGSRSNCRIEFEVNPQKAANTNSKNTNSSKAVKNSHQTCPQMKVEDPYSIGPSYILGQEDRL